MYDLILIKFDFTDAAVHCYQVTIGIEVEEQTKCPPSLHAAFSPLLKEAKSLKKTTIEDPNSFGLGPWTRVLLSRTIQVTCNMSRSVILTIPVDVTPDFETDLISVRTFLRFEFVTARKGNGKLLFPINNSSTQTSPWRIPLHVVPPIESYNNNRHDNDEGILLLSSSTRSSMLHVHALL